MSVYDQSICVDLSCILLKFLQCLLCAVNLHVRSKVNVYASVVDRAVCIDYVIAIIHFSFCEIPTGDEFFITYTRIYILLSYWMFLQKNVDIRLFYRDSRWIIFSKQYRIFTGKQLQLWDIFHVVDHRQPSYFWHRTFVVSILQKKFIFQ